MSNVAPIVSARNICNVGSSSNRTETDNHADTCCVSEDAALIIEDYDVPVTVTGYAKGIGDRTVSTVTAVVAYDGYDGKTYYLHIHNALLIDKLHANLLCPMQLRDRGLRINDEPKHMVPTPSEFHNAIYIPGNNDHDELVIPLSLNGVFGYFPTRKPTRDEYDASDPAMHIELTSRWPIWDPSDDRFSKAEASMLDVYGKLRNIPKRPDADRMIASINRMEGDVIPSDDLALALDYHRNVSAVQTKSKRPYVDAATLAKRWNIGIETAKRTIDATEQRAVRLLTGDRITRRFSTNDRKLRYRRLSCAMYTDTMFAKKKSWFRQNTCAQVYCTEFNWGRVYPMQKKSLTHTTLKRLYQEVGVPHTMIVDNSKEQIHGDFKKLLSEAGTRLSRIERISPWMQRAEGYIREVKRAALRNQQRSGSPEALWDHNIELVALIRSHTALRYGDLEGQVPETVITGQTADISRYVEHSWYDFVKAYDQQQKFPNDKEVLGRWLGPARDISPAMCAKILKSNGQILYTSTYRALTQEEWRDPKEEEKRRIYDQCIKQKMGGKATLTQLERDTAKTPTYDPYDIHSVEPIPDIDDATPEYQDQYIGAEVSVPLQGTLTAGKVKRRTRTEAGELFGKANDNPVLDTRSYDVEFPDGTINSYTANIIAINMLGQCDKDGNTVKIMDSIVDHKTNGSEVQYEDRFVKRGNNLHLRKTTKGWSLCILWKDGSTSWERLADVKESYPVEVAEYAVAHRISDKPAFAWWVPYVLKKRDRIIAAVNKRYVKRTHKFGIEIPKTVQRAYEIDEETGTTLWRDAIEKELQNVRVAFETIEEKDIPKGSQFIECHMIFDVKMEANFRRKARLVAGGHKTDAPSCPTYASVISRETVRIALTYAALNDLEVKGSDVKNAYLTAPCEENLHTILGKEFGPDAGKYAIITRALYGTKSAGSSFGRHLADCMQQMGFTPCKADPDLWMKMEQRPDDGLWYYSYVLFYVDDCLCIRHDAEECIREIDKYFPMKEGSIGNPDIYLGAKLRQVRLDNGVECWALSPTKYVQEAVNTTLEYIDKTYGVKKFPQSGSGPWPNGFVSELDESPELDPERANYYQSLVGILNWMVELGRVDIITETSVLASHMALPREGHLDAALHVFGYLSRKTNARMVFDPSYPDIDQSKFHSHDWGRFYGDVKEAIPENAPEPLGKPIDLRMMVDADFAGDKARRRSRTGFFIFMNSAPIAWMSKRQATCETSVFGAEFVAMKQGIEALRGIRYKLRMMGIPISGPSYIYGDNMSVVKNASLPESTLNKKSNSVCYHAVREAVAMGECLVAHISTNENLGDLATKLIPGGIKRSRLVDMVLYDIESKAKVG